MNALFNQLTSFIQWIYSSAQSIITFIQALNAWLIREVVIIYNVSNLVVPPVLQLLLGFMISFMLCMLIVKVVINLL